MADQPDYTGSCMIALYPSRRVAKRLAIEGGLAPADIHLTIAYTGAAADVDRQKLRAVAEALASRPPLKATISGHARFTGGSDGDVIVALVDSPELDKLRRDTESALTQRGIAIPSGHGFTAHCSIAYTGADGPDPVGRLEAFPVTFKAVSAVHGKDRTDCRFTGGDLTRLAAEAFTAGWALSGAPLTERFPGRCAAAVTSAVEHAHSPHVLEVALQIGKLEGAWALVFQRRENLIAKHTAAVAGAWRTAVKGLGGPGKMVRAFRDHAFLPRESAADDHWRATLRAEAAAAARGYLAGIYTAEEYERLAQAISEALAAAGAEGRTAALAVAAEETGAAGFDWALAYKHMYQPLEDLPGLPGMADGWVTRLVEGNAADIGQRLASLAADGAGFDEMVAAVSELTTGASIRAVESLIGYAMSGSAAQGALNLYQAEGAKKIAWLDAGDDRVDEVCEDNARNGPYTPAEFPPMPAHFGCRCVPGAVQTGLLAQAFAPYVTTAA